jgi:hypothetical protein
MSADNQAVRERETCRRCGETVPGADYPWKFAQAGGALAGPFCDRDCQLGWLLDG